ncbi:MAG TPA: response regulator [Ktedonosporobacter sp.]|nr:response regulator [Ktedonosporobacter sp.]
MPEQQTLPTTKEPSTTFKLILVVEDDIPFGSVLVQTIKEETPYQAILATTGMEALNIVSHLHCDLFLLDYLLPSMNGLELYDRLHAVPGHEKTPAFFLSASTRLPYAELEKRNLKSFTKLVELDELLQTIQAFVGEERAES